MKKFKFSCVLLSIISGLLLAFSFPRFDAYYLAWIAFIPLIFCCTKRTQLKHSFIYGIITGFVFNVVSLFWLYGFIEYNLESVPSAIALLSLLCLYLSIYFGLWSLLLTYLRKNYIPIITIIVSAMIWCVLEYCRTYLFTGFGLNLLGYSQAPFKTIIQMADLFGVYGVSFLVIIVNLILFYWLKYKKNIFFFSCLLVFLVALTYGYVRVFYFNTIHGDKISVGVIQPNIDHYEKLNPYYYNSILRTLKNNSNYFIDKQVKLLVWPETVIPGLLEDENSKQIIEAVSSNATLNLIGVVDSRADNVFNSILAIDKNNNIVGFHNKTHLVLFGEYIPFKNVLSKFFGVFNSMGNFTKSTHLQVLKYLDLSIGVMICSENFFTDIAYNLVNQGAKLLTVHINDSWFKDSALLEQHFLMNVFRAIENRKYVVVCANTGVSAVIDLTGNIVSKVQTQSNVSFESEVYQNSYITVYDTIENTYIYVFMIIIVLLLVISLVI